MAPSVVAGVVVGVIVAVTVIDGHGVDVTENVCEPEQPLAFFAVTV